MDYAVVGGDVRFAHLASMLQESGRSAKGFLHGETDDLAEIGRCGAVLTNWPMKWPMHRGEMSAEAILSHVSSGSTMLLCGPKFPDEKARRPDLKWVDLWADERLLRENAWLTAESAVASVVRSHPQRMCGLRCAVVGYGRIGQALTDILLNLGAEVHVVSGSRKKRGAIDGIGAKAWPREETAEALRDCALVFSTPPTAVVGAEEMAWLKPHALIVDLASPPYGVDLEAAKLLNFEARREPGLPGRYCPISAARALYNAVLRWEEDA